MKRAGIRVERIFMSYICAAVVLSFATTSISPTSVGADEPEGEPSAEEAAPVQEVEQAEGIPEENEQPQEAQEANSPDNALAGSIEGNDQQISPFLRDAKTPQAKDPKDSNSGAFVYEYPFDLPPGRLGMEPDLSLTYSSQSRRHDDLFGYGWGLNIPYIERVNYQGLEKLYDASSARFNSSLTGELATTTTAGSYVSRQDDGSYLRYTFNNNSWTALDKQGTTYTFGPTAASRQDSPSDPSRVSTWMLQEMRDTNGNTVTYSYAKDSGQIYPDSIVYTGSASTAGIFSVTFNRSERDQSPYTNDTGFPVRTNYKIDSMSVSVSVSAARTYSFAYSGESESPMLLKSIAMTGYEGATPTTLPPMEFSYTEATGEWELADFDDWEIPFKFVDNNRDTGGALADINGDGLTDIVQVKVDEDGDIEESDTWVRKPYGDTGWRDEVDTPLPCAMTIPDEDDDDKQYDTGTRIIDVNGDHLPDLVCNDQETYLNTGNPDDRWDSEPQWKLPFAIVYSTDGRDKGTRFPDLNGDGLPDLIRSYVNNEDDYEIFSAYLNTGNGWAFSRAWEDALEDSGLIFSAEELHDTGARLADVNGDGLDDILAGEYDEYGPDNEVLINTGTEWDVTDWYFTSRPVRNYTRILDFNSNGLADMVHSATDDPEEGHEDSVYSNTGTRFESSGDAEPPVDFTTKGQDSGTRIGEFNGDGVPDFVTYGSGDPGGDNWGIEEVNLSIGEAAELLSTVKDHNGGTLRARYRGAASYVGNQDMRVNPIVVASIERNDKLTGTTTDSYAYQGGKYYDEKLSDRRFMGFREVKNTGPEGHITKTTFLQDEQGFEKIGKPSVVERFGTQGALQSKTLYEWSTQSIPGGPNGKFVLSTKKTELSYDGDATHRDSSVGYSYNSKGNVTALRDYGEVSVDGGGVVTDIDDDLVTTLYTYATSTSNNVIGAVRTEVTNDNDGSKLSETRRYYDSLPLGQIDKGNLTKEELWIESSSYASTTHTYNANGLVTKDIDPRGNAISYAYDSAKLYVATSTNALNQKDAYTYDYSSGQVLVHKDPNGLKRSSVYDGLDRLVGEYVPDLSAPSSLVQKTAISYAYNPLPKVTRIDYLDGSNGVQTLSYFDGFGRLVQTRTETENGSSRVVSDRQYSPRGLLKSESLPYFSGGSAKTAPTTNSDLLSEFSYNILGSVEKLITADGTTDYDYDDWTVTVTDPLGNKQISEKDARGNLLNVREKNNGSTYRTDYTWDGLGNLLSITDALGNERAFSYDGLSRLTEAEDLHAPGDSTYGIRTYEYDRAGNRTKSTIPRGKTILYTYDPLNRTLTENNTDTSYTDVVYAYDASANYGVGKLSGVSTGSIGSGFDYDANGNLAAEQHVIPGAATTTTFYAYDRQANPIYITYPDGSFAYNAYNAGGKLEYVQLLENGTSTWASIVANLDYSPSGLPSALQYGNNTIIQNTYDPEERYRLTEKVAYSPSLYLQNFGYEYDNAGNITTLSDAPSPQVAPAKSFAYSYDDLYRLESASASAASTSPGYSHTFSYDALGSLLEKDGKAYQYAGNTGALYANPHAPTKIGAKSLTYDKDGNLTSFDGATYTWNYKSNLMKTVNGSITTEYGYNQDGIRVKKLVGSSLSTYPNRFWSTEGTKAYKQVYVGDALVATVATNAGGNDTTHFVYPDHLGSTDVIADEVGAPKSVFEYFPYGEERFASSSASFAPEHRYIGERYDEETGLSYLNARYYDGGRGQFVSQDPVFWEVGQSEEGKIALEDPQLQNSYSYAGNNPIVLKDPGGRWYEEFLSGEQDWNSFELELGAAASQLSQDSFIWNTAISHPYASGAVIGIGSGLTAYGANIAIGQAAIGARLGSLSNLPVLGRVNTLPNKGFDAIQKATGLSSAEAIKVAQAVGKSVVDIRPGNLGNINTIANIGEKSIRVTTNPNATEIISTGILSTSKIPGYISSGAMKPIPVISSAAKAASQYIANLLW